MTRPTTWLTLILCALAAAPALAATPAPARGREVVVLIHEPTPGALRGESIYTATETVLNHLGLIARYHDVADGLPDAGLAARARGVIALVEGAAASDPAALAAWVSDRLEAGQPVALLGGDEVLRARPDGRLVDQAPADAVLAHLGASEVEVGADASVSPGPHAPFEAGWALSPPTRALSGKAELTRIGALAGTDAPAALGLVGRAGAITTGLEAIRETNPLSFRLRWRLDPFWLFGTLFRASGEPALDTTTLNGRRIFYAHIDGDGFANRAIRRGTPFVAEVTRDEVLARTWLPTTVSVIASEIAGKPAREAIARSIFRLKGVSAASHSYHHPHDWAGGTVTHGVGADAGGSGLKAVAARLKPETEVDASLAYVATLLPPGKRVEAMLWSGETNPTPAFLARAQALGVANLNGGDASLDAHRPSYANVSPLARQVGPYLQVYASSANENLFTNLWTGPFDGQLRALALYRFTEAPRRLAPVNIYYHFYAAERAAGLKALQTLYRWAEGQPLAHLTAARYCRVVEGFYAGRVTAEGPGVWTVADAGACRTLRFDGEPRVPDWRASAGVAGYRHHAGALYVHLSGPAARVALTDRPVAQPHLHEASAELAAWQVTPHGLMAAFAAEAPLTVVLAGFGARQAVRVTGAKAPAHADAHGRLALSAPAGRRELAVRW